MRKNIILSVFAVTIVLLLSGNASAKTNVFIQNNTPFHFSVNNTVEQPPDHPLDPGSFSWTALSIQPGERIKMLEFPRFHVHRGDDYFFNSTLSLGADQILLRQRIHGTFFHSRLHFSAGSTSLTSGRQWQRMVWNTIHGNIEILYRSYFTGWDDDIEYVFNYEYPDFLDENTLNIAAYNTFLRVFPFYNGQSIRAALIPDQVRKFDVIIFSEVFSDNDRNTLVNALANDYPFRTQILGSDQGVEQDGGVMIISRHPIEAEDQVEYEEQTLLNFSEDMCTGGDCYAEKGVVYAKITKHGRVYHVFGSHTQAGSDTENKEIRNRQFQVIRAFINSKSIPANEAVIVGGDLNVDKGDATEFNDMLSTLGVVFPQTLRGHEHTVAPLINELTGSIRPKYLDYILYDPNHLSPMHSILETRILRSRFGWKEFFWENEIWELSDHFPVIGHFTYATASFFITPPALNMGQRPAHSASTVPQAFRVTTSGTGTAIIHSIVLQGTHPSSFSLSYPSLPASITAGQSLPIDVTLQTPAVGLHRAEVLVTGTDHLGASQSVRAVIQAEAVAPIIDIIPNTLSFSQVVVGQTATRNVIVANIGSSDLQYQFSAVASPFGIPPVFTSTWRTLTPGAVDFVPVIFRPTITGIQNKIIDIQSNGGTIQLAVEGVGIPGP